MYVNGLQRMKNKNKDIYLSCLKYLQLISFAWLILGIYFFNIHLITLYSPTSGLVPDPEDRVRKIVRGGPCPYGVYRQVDLIEGQVHVIWVTYQVWVCGLDEGIWAERTVAGSMVVQVLWKKASKGGEWSQRAQRADRSRRQGDTSGDQTFKTLTFILLFNVRTYIPDFLCLSRYMFFFFWYLQFFSHKFKEDIWAKLVIPVPGDAAGEMECLIKSHSISDVHISVSFPPQYTLAWPSQARAYMSLPEGFLWRP